MKPRTGPFSVWGPVGWPGPRAPEASPTLETMRVGGRARGLSGYINPSQLQSRGIIFFFHAGRTSNELEAAAHPGSGASC